MSKFIVFYSQNGIFLLAKNDFGNSDMSSEDEE